MRQVRAVSFSLGGAPQLRLPLISQCAPTLAAWNGCLHSLRLRDAFTKLSVPPSPPPVPFPLPLSGGDRCPSEAPADPPLLAAALLEVVSAESLGVGLAVGRLVAVLAGAQGGPVNVCARWRSVLWPRDLPSSPASCASPLPARHMAVFFFSSSLRFLPFSLSPPFFSSLSLSLSVFFVFLPENQSEERGRVKRESARKAGTNHPACTFVSSACRLSSLPLPKPIRLLAAHSNLTLPSQSLVGCRSCRGSTGGGTALSLRVSQGRWL